MCLNINYVESLVTFSPFVRRMQNPHNGRVTLYTQSIKERS